MGAPLWHYAGDWVLIKTSEQSGQADGLLGNTNWKAVANWATYVPASNVCPLGGTKTHFIHDNCSKLSRQIETGVSSGNEVLLYWKSFCKSIMVIYFCNCSLIFNTNYIYMSLCFVFCACLINLFNSASYSRLVYVPNEAIPFILSKMSVWVHASLSTITLAMV